MNFLPEPVQDTTYAYKHQLRFADVMRDLLLNKINCVFNIQFSQAFRMKYRHPDGSLNFLLLLISLKCQHINY